MLRIPGGKAATDRPASRLGVRLPEPWEWARATPSGKRATWGARQLRGCGQAAAHAPGPRCGGRVLCSLPTAPLGFVGPADHHVNFPIVLVNMEAEVKVNVHSGLSMQPLGRHQPTRLSMPTLGPPLPGRATRGKAAGSDRLHQRALAPSCASPGRSPGTPSHFESRTKAARERREDVGRRTWGAVGQNPTPRAGSPCAAGTLAGTPHTPTRPVPGASSLRTAGQPGLHLFTDVSTRFCKWAPGPRHRCLF